MVTLLSKDHHITEKLMMEFQPFGKESDGTPIRDIAGLVTRANLEQLEERVGQRHGERAGRLAAEELVRRLNERITDRAYHVTTEFLRNPWNSYSAEFQAYMGRFCSDISGDPLFHFFMGRDKAITPIVQVLGRPFTVAQIYRMSAYFAQRFAKALFYTEALEVSEGRAIIQMRFSEHALRQFGPYLRSCADMYCAGHRGYFTGVPERFHQLPPATVENRRCMVDGDDCCEWKVTWIEKEGRMRGIAASLARHVLKQEVERQKRIMEEQVMVLDTRHLELQESYVQQQQITAELQRRVNELTMLHRQIEELNAGLEAKVRERTAELELANERLREMDRLKSQFVSHVSHELRTPLTSIKGFMDNALSGLAGPLNDKLQSYLTRMAHNTDRLIRMIADLLEQSRIEAGKLELSAVEVDLRKCSAEVVEQLRPLAAAKRQRLELESEGAELIVWADEDRLIQILTNLIHNAIKYTPEEGQIVVLIGLDNPHFAGVRVRDTGEGIRLEALPKIFEPFFRVSREQRHGPKGLGLGLSIVKNLVELHGGRITVHSEEGQGSEFHVTIPLRSVARQPVDRPIRMAQRLLVIDDDPDIREFLVDRLGSLGYAVETAVDGATALHALTSAFIDGMILDIGIPEVDGLEVLRRVRERDATLPIIMITASGAKERAIQAVNMGAQAYLLKPFDGDALKDAVQQWFGPVRSQVC